MAGSRAKDAHNGLVPLVHPVEDWEVFIDFEAPAVEHGLPSCTRQPDSTLQSQQALIRRHAPKICAQSPREQDDIERNIISIGDGHLSRAAWSRAIMETGDESSLPTASSTISGNSQKSAKRKFEDCVSSFPTSGIIDHQPRKRQVYPLERRQEVAKVRKIRACQRCRRNKLIVSSIPMSAIGDF
jgi:hypothetical protein